MKLIQFGGGKSRRDGARGLSGAFPALLTLSGQRSAPGAGGDALGHGFDKMAGAFDQMAAALGAVRSIEGLVVDTRTSMEAEFAQWRKDQGELAALRALTDQAPRDLAAARQSEAVAKARLAEVSSELGALRVANASLETRVRESESEVEQLKAGLAGERKALADAGQTIERLNEQTAHLQTDLSVAKAEIQTLDGRARDAEAALASAERARGLLDADLIALRRLHEQAADEQLQAGRRLVDLESTLTAERARIAALESELNATRAEAQKVRRDLDQRAEAAASQAQLATGRVDTIQARADRQEEQIAELARLVEDLAARERGAVRDTAEAKLLRERADERARLAEVKLADAEKEAANALAARQAAVARAEEMTRAQQLKQAELERSSERETSTRQALLHLEQQFASERAEAEARIGELTSELERERTEKAVAEGSLEAVRRDRAAALTRLARLDAGLADLSAAELETANAG